MVYPNLYSNRRRTWRAMPNSVWCSPCNHSGSCHLCSLNIYQWYQWNETWRSSVNLRRRFSSDKSTSKTFVSPARSCYIQRKRSKRELSAEVAVIYFVRTTNNLYHFSELHDLWKGVVRHSFWYREILSLDIDGVKFSKILCYHRL